MFNTNLASVSRQIRCDNDCEIRGCPGHTLEIKVYSTSGIGEIFKDGVSLLQLDCSEGNAILAMLNQLSNN